MEWVIYCSNQSCCLLELSCQHSEVRGSKDLVLSGNCTISTHQGRGPPESNLNSHAYPLLMCCRVPPSLLADTDPDCHCSTPSQCPPDCRYPHTDRLVRMAWRLELKMTRSHDPSIESLTLYRTLATITQQPTFHWTCCTLCLCP